MSAVADVTGVAIPVRADMPPILSLRQTVVCRGGATILGPIDWTVRAGERWAVLGPNGAGKTTLLELAAGAAMPTGGNVELFGEQLDADDTDLDEVLPLVGWVSSALAAQLPLGAPALDVVLTGLTAGTRRAGESYAAGDLTRARELLARLGCRALIDRSWGSLSDGERKRVQVARALVGDPELLLLDEPATGLDLAAREALLRMLTRLATDPAAPAMVVVSHHVEEIPAGVTHALLLRDGEVVAAGAAAEVLTAPALSATFGLPLMVMRSGGRYGVRAMLSG